MKSYKKMNANNSLIQSYGYVLLLIPPLQSHIELDLHFQCIIMHQILIKNLYKTLQKLNA